MSDKSPKGDNEVKPSPADSAEELSNEDLEQVAGGSGKRGPSVEQASNEIASQKIASIPEAARGFIKG